MSLPKVPPLSTSFMLILAVFSILAVGRAPGPPRLRTRDLEVQITLDLENVDADA